MFGTLTRAFITAERHLDIGGDVEYLYFMNYYKNLEILGYIRLCIISVNSILHSLQLYILLSQLLTMFSSIVLLSGLVASALAHPAIEPRQSCTFTDAASAIKNKGSCSTIILNNIAVPAGTTLDLTKLKDGTHVS